MTSFYCKGPRATLFQLPVNWPTAIRAACGVFLLLILFSVQSNAQTAPSSITVVGQCLKDTYVLTKAFDNYEGTNRPGYSGVATVRVKGVDYPNVPTTVYYIAGPAVWVLSFDGQPYLSNSSTSSIPPTSGWQVVDNSSGVGNCEGDTPIDVATGKVTITPIAASTICGGSRLELTAVATDIAAPVSYVWASNPAGFSGTGNQFSQNAPLVNATTTYTISVTASSGVSSATASTSITVNPTPTLTLASSINPTTCGGSNGSLSFTTTNMPDGVYSFSYVSTASPIPVNVTVSNNAFTLGGLTAGTYSIFTISRNGCVGGTLTFRSLTDPPKPTLTLASSTNPATCGGNEGSISFTTTNLPNGTYSLSYTGSGSPKTITVSNNAFTLTGLSAGAYSNFSITRDNCVGTVAISQTLFDPPAPTLSLASSVNPTTCGGSNGSITFSTTNVPDGVYSLSYVGTGSPKNVTVSNDAFSLSDLAAGTYSSFSIVTGNNCRGVLAPSRTLSNPPTPTLILANSVNPTTCGGDNGSLSFTTNLPNGTYSLSYAGSGSPQTITVSNNGFTLSGLPAGTYSNFSVTANNCTGTLPTGTTLSDPVAPALTLTSSTACAGQPLTLSATSGFSSYTFTDGNGFSSTGTTNTTALSGLSVGTYSFSVTATAANGCTNTSAASATVYALPQPTLAASGTLTCAQTFVTLTAGGGTSYTFSGPGISESNTATGLATVTASGTYSVTVTANGCSSTTSIVVDEDVNLPAASAAITSAQNFSTCQNSGTSVVLTASCASGIYKWSDNSTGSSVSIPSSAVGSFPYSVSCVGANGCISPGVSATAVVNAKPAAPTLTPPADLVVCEPAALSLVVTASGTPTLTLTRNFMGSISNSTVTGDVTLTLPGSYTLSGYTTQNGCRSDDATALTGLTINPRPTQSQPITSPQNFASYVNGPSVVLTASCASGLYQWSDNSTGASVTVPSSATGSFPYSVSCVSATGCLSLGVSATATIAPNQPPVLVTPFAPISTTVGENLRVVIPTNAFSDPEQATLTYSVSSQPNWPGLSITGRTISGSVVAAGTYTLTITAADPYGASASGDLVVNVSPLPAGVSILPPFYNCQTGAFTFRVNTADKTPIQYMAEGITAWSSNPNQVVSAALRANPTQLTIYVRQRGVTYSRVVDLSSYCTTQAPARVAAAPEVPLTLTILGNPLTNRLIEAEVRGADGQSLQIEVINQSGMPVATQQIKSAHVVERLSIPVGNQPAGVLLLRVSTPGQSKIQKIINQ